MALIEYKNVSISHDDTCVLKDINFMAEEGQLIYIIGRVGTGKSSLLKTFYCELDIDSCDSAIVLGRDLTAIRRKEIPALRKEMGIVFQDFQLLHDRTVYKNFEFVLKATDWKNKDDITRRIEEVLKQVGMEDKTDSMPHELSGGEQQRISIARALLNEPKIILADEPTGNLDQETTDNIFELLKSISEQGTTVIVTTHNMMLLDKYPGIVYECEDEVLKIKNDEE